MYRNTCKIEFLVCEMKILSNDGIFNININDMMGLINKTSWDDKILKGLENSAWKHKINVYVSINVWILDEEIFARKYH